MKRVSFPIRLSSELPVPAVEDVCRRIPVVEGFEAEAVAVDDDGRNVQKRELQIRHMNAFRVHIDCGYVQMLLIVDTGFSHFVGEGDNHGAAAGCGFLSGNKSSL